MNSKERKKKKKIQIKAKRYISLIEVMIVLAIIGLVSTIVGIKSYSKIKSYSFEKAKTNFVSRIHHARRLAVINNSDAFMFVEKTRHKNSGKTDGILCEITFDKHRKSKPKNVVKYKNTKIYMEDDGDYLGDEFMLIFMSTGDIHPKKSIVIENPSDKKTKKFQIDLEKTFIKEFPIKKQDRTNK